jgi:ABC-type molybdate transport system substrate-binding protein
MKTSKSKSALMLLTALAFAATAQTAATTDTAANSLSVYAAGSLREALTVIAADYQTRTGQKIALTLGASGLLRERIEKGEAAQVFASADTEHPQRLANAGQWQQPTVFVRNALCALTSDKVHATSATLLATMLQPQTRLGTSTPKSDPSGDYTWAMFQKADSVQSGAYAWLDAKALKLTGAADSPKPPAGRAFYAWAMDEGQADVFLTYCTNAVAAQKEVPRLKVLQLPAELQVGAAYGVTLRADASAVAKAFFAALLAPAAQDVFARFGFGAP